MAMGGLTIHFSFSLYRNKKMASFILSEKSSLDTNRTHDLGMDGLHSLSFFLFNEKNYFLEKVKTHELY